MLETSDYQIQCNQQCHSLGIQRALVSLQRSGPMTQQCDRNFLRWRLITRRLSYSDDASWSLCRAVCLSAPGQCEYSMNQTDRRKEVQGSRVETHSITQC